METYMALFDVVSVVAFGTAAVAALRLSADRAGRGLKSLLFASAVVYLFVALSNVLEHGIGFAGLDPLEDYLEILFVPSLVYTAYALNMHANQQCQRRSAEIVRSQADLLLEILDVSPVGTLVADRAGKVTFASEGARIALGLAEAPDGLSLPDWRLLDAEGRPIERGFGGLCGSGACSDVRIQVAWPDGTRTSLLVSAAPLADRTGEVDACVVALEDVDSRLNALSS